MNNEYNFSQKEIDRQKILELVKKYANDYLVNTDIKDFNDGDRIPYSSKIFGTEEVCNLVDASLEFWLTQGRYYDLFEEKLAKFLGVKYLSYVNSGSSANLLAFMALTSTLLKERQVKKGDEVITVACGFPTTVAPIIQYGAVPVFVDVELPTYNIKVDEIEKAITDKTKAIMLAHTLGNPFDIVSIKKLCEKYNLWLIEDNCDALGAKVNIDGKCMLTGTIGDIGTSSFYPPHHMTTGEGGAVYTNNSLLHKIVLSMRDWGRDCVCKSGVDNTCKHRYDMKYKNLPNGYDHKYVYSHLGYNLKATDLQAAIGVAQIDRINSFVEKRNKNFEYLKNKLIENGLDKFFYIPESYKQALPSWFAFILTLKKELLDKNIKREDIVRKLEEKNIQTRMLFSGNILRQPCFDDIKPVDDKGNVIYRVASDLKNTDYILENTFLIGVYPAIEEKRIDYMIKSLKSIVEG